MAGLSGFQIPSLVTIRDRIAGNFNSRWTNEDARVPSSPFYKLVRVWAGVAHSLHVFAANISEELFPDTASGDYLVRHAALYGLAPSAAAQASGTLTVEVTGGSPTLPLGATFSRNDGVQYETTQAYTSMTTGTHTDIAVQAVESGIEGNADNGTAVTLDTPIAGITSAATVTADITNGSDAETTEALRARLLELIRARPQGGSAADYKAWTRAADTNVDKVWVEGPDGGVDAGEVAVYYTIFHDGSDVVPGSGSLTTVYDYIDDRRPVTAELVSDASTPLGSAMVAPAARTFAIEIGGIADATVRTAVEAEILAVCRAHQEDHEIKNSQVREAISRAAGEVYHTLNSIDGDSDGLSNVTKSFKQYFKPGTFTWA